MTSRSASATWNCRSMTYVIEFPASAFGGVNANIQALRATARMPIAASVPNARRSRSAIGTVISSARANRSLTNCRALMAMNSITATATVLSRSTLSVTRPEQVAAVEAERLDDAGDDRDDDREVRDPAEPAHGVDEVLLARPGEDDSGQQDHAADPDGHREGVQHASCDADQRQVAARAAEPDGGDGECGNPETRHLGRGVDDTVGPERDPARTEYEDQPSDRRDPGRAGIEQIHPVRRIQPAAERSTGRGRRRCGHVQHRAEHGDDPDGADELHRDEVLDAFGPCGGDRDERAEQDRHAEDRDHAAQPQRALPGFGVGRAHDLGRCCGHRSVDRRRVGTGDRSDGRSGGIDGGGGLDDRRDRSRR